MTPVQLASSIDGLMYTVLTLPAALTYVQRLEDGTVALWWCDVLMITVQDAGCCQVHARVFAHHRCGSGPYPAHSRLHQVYAELHCVFLTMSIALLQTSPQTHADRYEQATVHTLT